MDVHLIEVDVHLIEVDVHLIEVDIKSEIHVELAYITLVALMSARSRTLVIMQSCVM